MNCLGLDYGERHIGVAFSDNGLASPLTTLDTSQTARLLPQLVSGRGIQQVVIGLPDGPAREKAVDFIRSLDPLGIPVHVVDETMSSYDARMGLLHTTRSRRKSLEHSVAAAVILQSWLDSRKSVQQ